MSINREVSKACSALVAIFCLFTMARVSGAVAAPNVLFIAIDDLNDWVACLGGHPSVRTPHMNLLADRGVLFTNAHCASPICGPSRASVLTGRRPETTGVYHNKGSYLDYVGEEVVPLPMFLRKNGYRSVGAGKINHGFTKVDERNWDDYGPSSGHIGGPFTEEELSTAGDDYPGRRVKRGKLDVTLPMCGISTLIDRPGNAYSTFDWGPMPLDDDEMPDGQVAAWAVEQLGKKHEEPLFLAAGIYRPHQPLFAPQRYFDLYETVEMALPRAVAGDLWDVPEPGRQLALKGWTSGCHRTVVEHRQWRHAIEGYLACVSFADAQVGRMIKALDESGQADNTVVILHWGKHTPWERATRVPLIIVPPKSFPMVLKGDRNNSPVSLLDLYPTIVEMCGLEKPEGLEGRSLVPLLRDSREHYEEPVVVTVGRGTQAVVDRHWRYIRWFDGSEELYWKTVDGAEVHNVADEPRHAGEKERLARSFVEDERFKGFARLGHFKAVLGSDDQIMLFDFDAPGGISEQTDVAAEFPQVVEKIRAAMKRSGERYLNVEE